MNALLGLWAGFGVAVALFAAVWTRTVRGLPTPDWVFAIGVLSLVVAGRRGFSTLTPDAQPAQWVQVIEPTVQIGIALVVVGGLSVLVGLAAALRRRVCWSLVGYGLIVATAGSGWALWAAGSVALWQASGRDPVQVEVVRSAAEASLRGAKAWLGLAGLLTSVVAALAVRQERWHAVRGFVAVGTLTALVIGTGGPASTAVARASDAFRVREVCAGAPGGRSVSGEGCAHRLQACTQRPLSSETPVIYGSHPVVFSARCLLQVPHRESEEGSPHE